MTTETNIKISADIYATVEYYEEDGEPSVNFRNKWEGGISYLSLSEWRKFVPIITYLLEQEELANK